MLQAAFAFPKKVEVATKPIMVETVFDIALELPISPGWASNGYQPGTNLGNI